MQTPALPRFDEEPEPLPARHGSAEAAVGDEPTSAAVDIPWDDYLGAGATGRVSDGSLGLVRHSYPATAAQAMRAASTVSGQLGGDAAAQERLAAIAIGVAGSHHRPARMPHRPGEEPHAWWIAEERTLVWLPWADVDEPPYGLELLDSGEADSVVVLAPDAAWTVFRTGVPAAGGAGSWAQLSVRLQQAVVARVGHEPSAARWRRRGDEVAVSWREAGETRTMRIAVNSHRDPIRGF